MFGKNFNRIFLVVANIFLVFFLIALSNLRVLPLQMGDFIFFTILTFALALYRPSWVFLFFVGTIMLENINLAPEIGIAVRPYQFFGGITILALIIRLLTKRLNFKLIKLIWPDYLAIAMGVASFLSIANASNKSGSLKQSIILVSFIALYFLARNFLQTSEDIKKVAPFFLSSSVVVMMYGIWQNVRFAKGLSNFEVMAGRPNATFAEADWFGMYLVFLLACTYAIIYFTVSEFKTPSVQCDMKARDTWCPMLQIPKNLYLVSCILYLVLIFISLILTVSRSAWLGALFVTIFFLFAVFTQLKISPKNWKWKRTIQVKIIIISAFLVSLGIVYIFNLTTFQLFNRAQSTGSGLQKITISCNERDAINRVSTGVIIQELSSLEAAGCRHINLEEIDNEKAQGNFVTEVFRKDPNVNIRSEIYKKSWEIIKQHPILGIGWGGISAYLGTDERGAGLNASNIFLEVWLGSGSLGLLAFISIWIFIFIRAMKNFVQKDLEAKAMGMFMLLGIFAILIPNLFNSGIMLGFLWLFLGAVFIKN